MDHRPLGSRHPDRRSEAYESIFGRPSAAHHLPTQSLPPVMAQGYVHSSRGPAYHPQYHYVQDIRQPSHRPPFIPPHYENQPQQHHPAYYHSSTYGPPNLAPPSVHTRARSFDHGHLMSPAPSQFDHSGPGLEALTRQGLTPAQAYQTQVYLANPHLANPSSSLNPPVERYSGRTTPEPPQLGLLNIDGNLEIDFGHDSSPEQDQDSELPWASGQRTPTLPISATPRAVSPPSNPDISEPRKSSESTNRASVSSRRGHDRVRSISANPAADNAKFPFSNSPTDRNSPSTAAVVASRRTPVVYPALLSCVAQAFMARITLSERTKDGLTYTDAFSGREAVDKIAYIIKTTDRNLALLLGRALDAQKFFHDVTYDHRLRDNSHEFYQFQARMPTPFSSADDVQALAASAPSPLSPSSTTGGPSSTNSHTTSQETASDAPLMQPSISQRTRAQQAASSPDDIPLPSGVFTLLTDCYSPTCTRDYLCYSIACPRRLEQQARLNMKPQPGLQRSISKESLGDVEKEPGQLWVHSVPQEVVDSVSEMEKKRQEAINEVIYTEKDFVRDMEYLRDVWVKPLQTTEVIPEERRDDFVQQVFWNVLAIIGVNTKLRDSLLKRQKQYAIVDQIGDILLEHVPNFQPFVDYGAHQLYGKYEFEMEKGRNPAFSAFVDQAERLPESRKLELNGYLTKPTTRLARYPLLLEVVHKYTPDDSPDKVAIPEVIKIIKDFLNIVNIKSGEAENKFHLTELSQQLSFRPGEEVDLRLADDNRQLVYKGPLRRRGGTQGDSGDLQVFLFDHALLAVKQKAKGEQFKVYRRPIPLELLLISSQEETASTRQAARQGANKQKSLVKKPSFTKSFPPSPISVSLGKQDGGTANNAHSNGGNSGGSKSGFPITFIHLGRNGYSMTLYAGTSFGRKKWVESIQKQQEELRERSLVFDTVLLGDGFFTGVNKVNCATPFNGGRRMAYGTDDGVYFTDFREPEREPIKVLALADVTQVDILEDFQLLIVLSERSVITFPMDALDARDPTAGHKRAKKVSTHTSFFKAGTCLGRTLVCVVKASALSSTIKTLEPIDQSVRGKSKPTFRKLIQGGNDTLKVFREFYIPTESSSIHFLKTKLCVGCTKGFEIVDLESLDTQGLLDPDDPMLEFVQRKENVRPMAIYRIDNEFLLCYDEFAFFVNKSGRRARPKWRITWEGTPTAFALQYPYVLAFEPTFVEIRHIETERGELRQVIPGNNLRCLYADTPPSTTNSAASSVYSLPYTINPMVVHPSPYGYHPNQQIYTPRQSGYSSYAPAPLPPSPPRGHGDGRNEIILVSDDRVMALRFVAGVSDSVSMRSLPG